MTKATRGKKIKQLLGKIRLLPFASSAFGSNQRWAPFFSAGIGVNIHNYDFLKNNKVINMLKVRGSYGRTGKVSFPAYAATTMYETLFDEWYATGFGAVLQALGNRDLTWEKTGFAASLQ